jgi:hypothetical protein
MESSLYNKVLEQIKLRKNFNSFKRDVQSFLLKHSFYSVNEFMQLSFLNECITIFIKEQKDAYALHHYEDFRLQPQ